MTKAILGLIVCVLAVIYWSSFTSPFFQDDALLLQHAAPQYFLTPVPPFHYHPISNQLFYLVSKHLFGTNVFGYHLILFAASCVSLILVFKISKQWFKSMQKAVLATFFYAFNVSLFANFYWIAISYFVFGGMFFFASTYFLLQKAKLAALLSLVCFALAVGSNELVIFFLPILLATAWYSSYWPKRLWLLFSLDTVFLGLKIFWVSFSSEPEYKLHFGTKVISAVRWYILRALNLPEGVNRSQDVTIICLFTLLMLILAYSLVIYVRRKKINTKLFMLAAIWFAFGALPFYFLPNHMSSYYLTVALFGPAMIFGEILDGKRLVYLTLAVYLLLSVRGLNFLSQTHWIILKNTGPIGSF